MQHFSLSMPQAQTRQPSMKPGMNLNTSSSSTYFAPITSQMSEARFRESEHAVRQQQEQLESLSSSERVTTLHARLEHEADKIRKWKLQTEIELKQKERKIQDATQTIESLRKSMLNQQLQNENLSLKLQEEIDNREEIMQKIKATRNMCDVLKCYAEKLEDRMQKCETEKTELKYLEKQHMTQFEELSGMFRQLEISATENAKKLTDAVKSKVEENSELKVHYEERLQTARTELHTLTAKHETKDKEIQVIKVQLDQNILDMAKVTQAHNQLQEKVKEAESSLERQNSELALVHQELDGTKNLKTSLESQLDEATSRLHETLVNKEKLAKNFDETEKLYVNKIKSVQDELAVLQAQLERSKQRSEELQTRLDQADSAVEDLKHARDVLSQERTEAIVRIEQLEKAQEELCEKLQATEDELTKTARNLLDEKDDALEAKTAYKNIQCELQQTQKAVTQKKREVDSVKTNLLKISTELAMREDELKRSRANLSEAQDKEKELQDKLDSLTSELKTESGENQAFAQDLQEAKKERQKLQKELNASKKECTKLKKELEKSEVKQDQNKIELDDAFDKLKTAEEQIADLENQLADQTDTTNKLQEEINNFQQLEGELTDKNKHADEMEGKVKGLKTDLTTKNKQIKDLEKQIKQLKSEVTKQTKVTRNMEDLTQDLQAQLETAKEEQDKEKAEIEEFRRRLEETEKMMKEKAELATQLEAKTKKAMEEKEAAEKLLEVRTRQVAGVMDEYKDESDRIVAMKNKEVEDIRKQLQDSKKQGADVKHLEKELETSKEKNVQCETEMREKTKRLQEQEEKITKLEEELKQKTSQISELEKAQTESEPRRGTPAVKPLPVAPCTPQLQQPRPEMPVSALRTPRQNKTPQMKTPKNKTPVMKTPLMKTPQSARAPLLKVTPSHSQLGKVSIFKKRKVQFTPEEEDAASQSSSSSELMECEVDELEKRLRLASTPKGKAATPLTRPRRVSPIRKSKSPMSGRETFPRPRTPVKPASGKSKLQSKRQKMQEEDSNEMTQFKELFPIDQHDQSLYGTGAKSQTKKTKSTVVANTRKAPSKTAGSKFFTSSPRERRMKKKKEEDIPWFDTDAVFGMGPED